MTAPVDVPLFPPKARLGLLAFVLGGAIAGVTYRSWAMENARAKPKPSACFVVAGVSILSPALESGTEPQENDAGETVYLVPKADKAVRCAAMFGDGTTATQRKLATLLAETDPEARAKKYMAYVDAIPKDASGDVDAAAWGLLIEAIFSTAPKTPALAEDRKRATDVAECRFGRSGCSTPHPLPTVTWGAAGVGVLGLLGAIGGLVAGVVARRKGERVPAPPGPGDPSADAATSEDAEPSAPRKKKKGGVGPGVTTLMLLAFLAACQTPTRPSETPPRPEAPPPAARLRPRSRRRRRSLPTPHPRAPRRPSRPRARAGPPRSCSRRKPPRTEHAPPT